MSDVGKILKVDLETGRITQEPVPAQLRREYLGGEGLSARLLWDHFLDVDPHIDPLSPQNPLIAGVGPLVGTCLGTGGKMKFTYKSPAYHIYGDTSVGGNLGSELRWAGYDHIVITGKAKHPVYLSIRDDDVQIRDARRLWGTSVPDADDAIRQELGDDRVETACIGQAGENLVRFASIMVSRHRAAGRGGGGCVMGSKNLKAIVARGTKGIPVQDPRALLLAADELQREVLANPATDAQMRFGTLIVLRRNHVLGFNTFHNGQGLGMPDDAVSFIDHNWYRENIGVRPYACSAGCILGCGHWHHISGNESPTAKHHAGQAGTRPEYGSANPFGNSCDCQDMVAITHFNAMCNEYGMDVMEIGMTISLLMELWERGIITEQDTRRWTGGDPLSLEWGNQEAMHRIVEAIGLQSGELGRLLQGGVYRVAQEIGSAKGVDVMRYANYGKAGATHEGPARSKPPLSFACAVASIGAHHLKSIYLTPAESIAHFGCANAADSMTWELKGAAHTFAEHSAAIGNSLGLCRFSQSLGGSAIPFELIARALSAVTGITLTAAELSEAAERVVNIQKAFNSRLGLRRAHDTLCHRWLNEPQLVGAAKGMKAGEFLEATKDEYYDRRGWDRRTGLQTRAKLAALGMTDVAAVLERDNALVAEVVTA